MIIDAHHHLWDRAPAWTATDTKLAPLRRPYTVDDLRDNLRRAGIDHTVLVEADGDDDETARFLDLAADTPEIAGVVGRVRFGTMDTAEQLRRWRNHRHGRLLVGVREQIQHSADPDRMDHPQVHAGLAAVADAQVAFDLVIRADQLPAAARAATAFPQLTFVLDHLGNPPITADAHSRRQWADGLAMLAEASNVVAKVSGLLTQADWRRWSPADLRPSVDTAVELFGDDRLMFGSDWPVCELSADYGQVLHAAQAALNQCDDTVFARTAIDAYRLSL